MLCTVLEFSSLKPMLCAIVIRCDTCQSKAQSPKPPKFPCQGTVVKPKTMQNHRSSVSPRDRPEGGGVQCSRHSSAHSIWSRPTAQKRHFKLILLHLSELNSHPSHRKQKDGRLLGLSSPRVAGIRPRDSVGVLGWTLL